MQIKYRVHYVESERGWGQEHWHVDYDTEKAACEAFDRTNMQLTGPAVPDVYIKALRIEAMQASTKQEKTMPKETAAERRAREAEEARTREALWEAEKPMRLLMALARANDLDVPGFMTYKHDGVLYYSFNFGGWNVYTDPFVELGELTMQNIENELADIEAKRAKERRLRQVKEKLLASLTDEEREALGL
jgi:hypothetical protein